MISLFCGERGSGKTKRMVDHANAFADKCDELSNGYAVYFDRDYDRMYELNREVRLINLHEFGIFNSHDLIVFIKGLVAYESDIRTVYIDSVEKIINALPCSMQDLFLEAEKLCDRFSLDIFFTIHCKIEELPSFMQKYAIISE